MRETLGKEGLPVLSVGAGPGMLAELLEEVLDRPKAAVDLLLATPATDCLAAQTKVCGDLADALAGLQQLQDSATEPRPVSLRHGSFLREPEAQESQKNSSTKQGKTKLPTQPGQPQWGVGVWLGFAGVLERWRGCAGGVCSRVRS